MVLTCESALLNPKEIQVDQCAHRVPYYYYYLSLVGFMLKLSLGG
jgi:hypothetical protein